MNRCATAGIVMLVFLNGCAIPYGYREVKSNYGLWEPYKIDNTNPTMSLEDVTWTVLGPHTARVSGKISCEYDSVTKERQPYDYIRYQDYRYPDFTGRNHHTNEICGQGRAYNHRTGGTTRQTYVPTTVKLRNPYGPDVTVSVNSDGRFSGEVAIGERYYFTRLSVPAYYGKYHHTSPSKLRVSIPPHESLTFPNKYCELPKFHFAKPNVGRAEQFAMNYASGVMCPVQIAFKEQTTRRDVSPQVTITPTGVPTSKEILGRADAAFRREFSGDKTLCDAAMKKVKYRLGKVLTSTRKDTAQSMSFTAWVGGKYKVETIHGEYHFFRGFVSPRSSDAIDKAVLLVEKGQKIRVQGVREGEGGSMVDSE